MRLTGDGSLKDRIFDLLDRARLDPRRDVHASSSPETLIGNPLLCDVVISRGNAPGIGTIIVCAEKGSAEDLACNLGRAMFYRHELGADHAIICLPSQIELPPYFIETCDDVCIHITDEDDILNTLAAIGVVTPEIAAVHTLTRWLQRQRMSEWSADRARAWMDDLEAAAEFHAELRRSYE